MEIFPQIFGQNIFEEFCQKEPEWVIQMTNAVSSLFLRSRNVSGKTNFKLPRELEALYAERTKKSIREEVQKQFKHLNVNIFSDKLRFDRSIIETIVASCIADNTSLIRKILTKHRFSKINTVVIFGTLLESEHISNAMAQNFDGAVIFSNKIGVNATIKAAILHGFTQNELICSFTYGVNVCDDFHEDIHTSDHKVRMVSDSDMCQNLFRRYFMKREKIVVGQLRYRRYRTIFPYQRKILVYILQSDRREPKYADENGIKGLDVISVDLGRDVKHGEIEVRMMLTETKLAVEAFLVQERTNENNEKLTKVYSKRFSHFASPAASIVARGQVVRKVPF
jgi:hypothetical protein